jgi:ATP-dependent RNA helicase RhlB
MSERTLTETEFRTLPLSPALLRGLDDLGFHRCTPIQARTLPLALAGRDVAGQAQTGTGKTIAFLLALMNHLMRFSDEESPPVADHRQPRALVLAPTRELAIQIHRDAEGLSRHTGLRMGLVYGGTGYDSQRRQLEDGVDVLIGTPGRLIDYFKQRVYSLRHVEVVVLDEADRMFDLGFIADIRYLLRRMPPPGQRLNMLFSATLSARVHELSYEHMNTPEVIEIAPEQVTGDRVRQSLYHVSKEEKISLLLGILHQAQGGRVLVFVNTRRGAERVAAYLTGSGHEAAVLSGDIPQKRRQRLLERFTRGDIRTLVATDVAARGLHIPEVSHVVNFDLPQDAEDYVHRIGRTARAGASGAAISLACEQYVYSLPEIEAYIGQKLAVEPITEELLVEPGRPIFTEPRPKTRSAGGGRERVPRRPRQKAPSRQSAEAPPGPGVNGHGGADSVASAGSGEKSDAVVNRRRRGSRAGQVKPGAAAGDSALLPPPAAGDSKAATPEIAGENAIPRRKRRRRRRSGNAPAAPAPES